MKYNICRRRPVSPNFIIGAGQAASIKIKVKINDIRPRALAVPDVLHYYTYSKPNNSVWLNVRLLPSIFFFIPVVRSSRTIKYAIILRCQRYRECDMHNTTDYNHWRVLLATLYPRDMGRTYKRIRLGLSKINITIKRGRRYLHTM